jgi:hypothetical protein
VYSRYLIHEFSVASVCLLLGPRFSSSASDLVSGEGPSPSTGASRRAQAPCCSWRCRSWSASTSSSRRRFWTCAPPRRTRGGGSERDPSSEPTRRGTSRSRPGDLSPVRLTPLSWSSGWGPEGRPPSGISPRARSADDPHQRPEEGQVGHVMKGEPLGCKEVVPCTPRRGGRPTASPRPDEPGRGPPATVDGGPSMDHSSPFPRVVPPSNPYSRRRSAARGRVTSTLKWGLWRSSPSIHVNAGPDVHAVSP